MECLRFTWNPTCIEACLESLWGRPRFKLNSPHLISFKQQVETFYYFGNLLALPSQTLCFTCHKSSFMIHNAVFAKKRTFARKPFGAAFDSLAPAIEKNDFFTSNKSSMLKLYFKNTKKHWMLCSDLHICYRNKSFRFEKTNLLAISKSVANKAIKAKSIYLFFLLLCFLAN